MDKKSKKRLRRAVFFVPLCLVTLSSLLWVYFSTPYFKPWLRNLTRKSDLIPPEEKRIREEVILKKMEDPNLYHDWKSLAPEYPRPNKLEGLPAKERQKALKETPEFKEMDKELKSYLQKKGDQFRPDVPVPSLKEAENLIPTADPGAEKVMERLISSKAKNLREKPQEENVLLGIKGPLASRKILERPAPPHGKVKVETEIELTFWVLPDGIVDRVVPSVRGDAELERVAIQYLKQWRFAPLPKGQLQAEQWGTIPIKFRLQ